MPSAPPAVNSVISNGEHAVVSGIRDPAPVARRVRLHKTKTALASSAARRTQNATASARSSGTKGRAAIAAGNQLRRAADAMRQVFRTNYYDPLFERPDTIEDDYNRFRNQPYGY